jgi:sialic acid synthase SpsE
VMSVADEEALARVSGVPLAVLHLPAAALLDLPLVSGAAASGVPLWLDTAMASIEEVAEAVAAALKVGARVLLLHGLTTAAGRSDEINLRALATLNQRFRLPVGFQARQAAPVVATASVVHGATVLAVPFSDDGREGFDAVGLAALHADVRLVARALGDGDKRVQPSEWAERDRTHRRSTGAPTARAWLCAGSTRRSRNRRRVSSSTTFAGCSATSASCGATAGRCARASSWCRSASWRCTGPTAA